MTVGNEHLLWKTADSINMPFWMVGQGSPRNNVLDGGPDLSNGKGQISWRNNAALCILKGKSDFIHAKTAEPNELPFG